MAKGIAAKMPSQPKGKLTELPVVGSILNSRSNDQEPE